MFSTQTKHTETSVQNDDHPLLSDRHVEFQLIGGSNNIHEGIICYKADLFQQVKLSSKSEHTKRINQPSIVSYVFKSESKRTAFHYTLE